MQQATDGAAPGGNFGADDYANFERRMEARTGLRLRQYKSDQMRRRLAALSRKAGCDSFAALAAAVERDPSRRAEFLSHVTINVTELMRNPERFDDLAAHVLPDLLAHRRNVPLSVWSAGCSYGAEAYTVALLLHELSPALPHRIKGTDIDREVLARAERPGFSPADMANVSPARRQAHFEEAGGVFQPRTHLRGRVRFAPHDLLADPFPPAEYDLILCRNVLIYFTDDAKDQIYRGFFRALRPGGVLFVGGTERLSDHRAVGFDLLRPFFYRKP